MKWSQFKDNLNTKMLAVGVAMTMPALAHADFSAATSEVSSKFDAGETALSSVFAATVEIYVIRRVWRIIRSSI